MPVAYITGATSGIGRATAERFIEEGWTVVAMARREERLQELKDAHPDNVHCFKLDVRDKAAVEHVFAEAKERFGAPDVLVNNAGLALGLEPAQACSLDDWDTMVDTNIKGLLYCTRAALPGMVERHSGHVVNLGSIAGTYAYPGSNVYGASKGFVLQFSRGLRCDLHGTGVHRSRFARIRIFQCPFQGRRIALLYALRERAPAPARGHRRHHLVGRFPPRACERLTGRSHAHHAVARLRPGIQGVTALQGG